MHVFKNSTTLLVGGLLAFSVPVWAQAGQNSQNPSQSSAEQSSQQSSSSQAASQPSHSATSANQRAADLLNTINKGEIDTAKMIQGKTQNSQVKDFTSTIINDHQDAQNKLESVASQSSLNLQTNPAMQKKDQQLKNRLQNESNAQADKAYVRAEVRDHQHAISQLKRLEPKITDQNLKSLVQSNIPVLQKHLQDAQSLEQQLGSTSGANASPASNSGQSAQQH